MRLPKDYMTNKCVRDRSMRAAHGGLLDPLKLEPGDLTIDFVARSLSRINRFCGSTICPLSVAEHSVVVSYMVPRDQALPALMHDAHEVIISDIPSPAKKTMGRQAKTAEDVIAGEVRKLFGLPLHVSEEIKAADKVACYQEAALCFNRSDVHFMIRSLITGVPPEKLREKYALLGRAVYELVDSYLAPRGTLIMPMWDSTIAYEMFVQRYEELTDVRKN